MSGHHTIWLVGCSHCSELWFTAAGRKTTDCPRCRTTYRTRTLRKFAEDTDRDALVEKRTQILASRSDPRARDQYRATVDDALTDYDSLEDAAQSSLIDEAAVRRHIGADDAADLRSANDESTTSSSSSSGMEEPESEHTNSFDPLGIPLPVAADSGISRIPPEQDGQTDLSTTVVYRGLQPQMRRWIPSLLEDLLPTLTAAVAQWTVDQDTLTLEDANTEGIATALLDKLDIDPGTVEIDGDRQAPVEVRAWVRDLVAFTVRAVEEDVTINDAPESLTRIGTGRGLLNAGRAALRAGPVALLDVLEVTPQVAATLNEGEWVGTRKETRARSLGALDSLSDALDIQLVFSTPRMESLLVEDHPDWTSRHLNLTEDADTSYPSKTDTAAGEDAALAREAWDILREREWSGTGYTRILGNIPASGATRGDLAADDDVSLSEGSIYAYVDDLAATGFVTIDDSTRPSRVVLTELGASIADYVDAKGSVQNPVQASLTQSPNRGTSECTPQHQQDPPGDSHQLGDDRVSAAESFLARTGDVSEDGYTRFLGRYSGGTAPREIEPATLHHQLQAGRCTEGVSVVEDANLQKFDDGRVSYLSGGPSFDDDVAVVLEWGNPLGTLARLVGTLLGSRAWSKILRRSRLGSSLENLWAGADQFDSALADVAKFGAQMGWMSSREESDYLSYRERLEAVRCSLLEDVGRFDDLDYEQRSALLSKLIGLATTATTLYHAAGYDLTVHLRVPDSKQLRRDDDRYGRFLAFFRSVVAKQGVYRGPDGVHSIYRMQRERRSEKLKRRLGYEIDPGDPRAELTCSWVVAVDGTGGEVASDIEGALCVEDHRVRERIQEGTEEAAVMDVPVVVANGAETTRRIVEAFAMKKGFSAGARQDLDRLVNVIHAALGTQERAPSPFDVAAVMQALESKDEPSDKLDVGALARGIATLPANRLLPSLFDEGERPKLAIQKMVRALLGSDGAVSRGDLVEVSSQNSVDRYLQRLRALDIVERVGPGEYRAYLEPWWVSGNGQSEPYSEAYDGEIAATGLGDGRWDAVLLGAAHELGADTASAASVEAFSQPVVFEEVLEAHPVLEQYEHILRVYVDGVEEDGPPSTVARIGSPPPGTAPDQQTLTAAVSSD
ncbi:replication protein (plasmid) [Halobacterium salinarum NRC-1]|uniref:RepI n=2 Tax=Halobacterium salinarum TaxID=2242 RepID=O51999_HALSA|nr:hypothetical protein [Halobacterium salinarum]AAC82879.1 RepI [Halobacterium salinarum NRC-1]AAG20807.1 replication protein [Halobacterium salinarum NRC-1]DAC79583.1 TPA_inf: plasmid replication protein RepI [Halobacterium salinarum NRC-1]DAC79780.1 TPA_inf: plasmid replication protein RepI [Halobacterium salinarum NRC-1]